jgi:dihydropyrimidinase
MPDKAIVNGKAVLPGGACECSIVMGEEGRIKAILDPASPINSAECEIVDAKDCIIFPGGIDAHVHLVDGYDDMPVHPADNCYTGTMAALAGGTTTIVDFVCSSQEKKESPKEIIVRRKEQASNCVADYAFQYTFTQRYEQELKELDSKGRYNLIQGIYLL